MKKSHFAGMSLALTATCIALVGCSVFQAGQADTGSIHYAYAFAKTRNNDIVQVYDLDGRTVVQLKNAQSLKIAVLDDFNKSLNYKIIGENIVLEGIQSSFTVTTQAGASHIVNTALVKEKDAKNKLSAGGSADSPAESEQALRDEIAQIKGEIASLKAQLAIASVNVTAPAKEPNKIIVPFRDNSTAFNLSNEQQQKLLELATKASEISIKGYTDSTVDNARSASLAERRAKSAQAFLVQKGISQQMISLAYFAAGGFIADNKLADGRAKNRRVEISIL